MKSFLLGCHCLRRGDSRLDAEPDVGGLRRLAGKPHESVVWKTFRILRLRVLSQPSFVKPALFFKKENQTTLSKSLSDF